MNLGQISQDTLNKFSETFNYPMGFNPFGLAGSDDLKKSLAVSNGLVGYNLSAVISVLEPFFPKNNLILNRLKRSVPQVPGKQAEWKQITSVKSGKSSGYEGKKGRTATVVTEDKSVPFKTTILGGSVTLQAQMLGKGFLDAKAKDIMLSLFNFRKMEELKILGGNITTLGTCTQPTATVIAGGAITAGDYVAYVAPLTVEAANNILLNTQQASLALIGDTDGDGAAISGQYWGVGNKGTARSFTTETTNLSVTLETAAKAGAAAYAWFVGASGSETLQIVTTNPKVTLTSLVSGGSAKPSSDGTADAQSYDGIIPQVVAAGTSGGNIVNQANAALTPVNGGVKEIDEMLDYIYNATQVVPTTIMLSPQCMNDLAKATISGTGAPSYMVERSEKGILTASYAVNSYLHKTTGQTVKCECHSYLPNGMIMFLSEALDFSTMDIPVPIEMILALDYFQLEYQMTKPTYEYDVLTIGALAMRHPKANGLIYNIKAGLAT